MFSSGYSVTFVYLLTEIHIPFRGCPLFEVMWSATNREDNASAIQRNY